MSDGNKQPRNIPQRSIYVRDEMWNRLRAATGERGAAEGHDIGISELVRRGIARELAAIEGNGEYERPEGYDE